MAQTDILASLRRPTEHADGRCTSEYRRVIRDGWPTSVPNCHCRAGATGPTWAEAERAAEEIEALRGALLDALVLLPPNRWSLLLPRYADVRSQALGGEA